MIHRNGQRSSKTKTEIENNKTPLRKLLLSNHNFTTTIMRTFLCKVDFFVWGNFSLKSKRK